MALKLYLISQNVNNCWDTYDSAVVIAETEEQAKLIHPSGDSSGYFVDWTSSDYLVDWASSDNVKVILLSDNISSDLGKAWLSDSSEVKAGQVVCASFNAG